MKKAVRTMKRKWHKGRYGVESLDAASEFVPRKYKSRIIDLRRLGVPYVPVIGQASFRVQEEPSPWHVHRGCVEFVLCTAGTCVYESAGRRYRLKPGMMFVSRAEDEHRQLDCPKGFSRMHLHFQPSAGASVKWFEEEFKALPRLFACSPSVASRFGAIFAHAESQRSAVERKVRLQVETQALFLAILDSAAVQAKRTVSGFVDVVARRMRGNPSGSYPLDELASEGGLSKASFISQFKAALGNSPHSYLLFCRVEASKRLLKKRVPFKDVADMLGFSSPRVFSRTFKNFEGLTPSDWLKRG